MEDMEQHTLERVMACLDQQSRLTAAATVCRRWHAAALAATAAHGASARGGPALVAFLRNGALPKLQALAITRGTFCNTGDPDASCLTATRELRRLVLTETVSHPELLTSAGCYVQGLCHLALHNVDWGPLISTARREELASAVVTACSHLTALTHLSLQGCDLDDACLPALPRNLTRLRELNLASNQLLDATRLAPLPPLLTILSLQFNRREFDFGLLLPPLAGDGSGGSSANHAAGSINGSSSSSSIVTAAPPLVSLGICRLTMRQPERLGALTQLTQLLAGGLAIPEPRTLLRTVAGLRGLRHLDLSEVLGPGRLADLRHMLQALSSLTHLDISGNALLLAAAEDNDHQQEQPPSYAQGAAAALFAGVSLPHLATLHASSLIDAARDNANGNGALQWPLFCAGELCEAVAAACPALTDLSAHGSCDGCAPSQLGALLRLAPGLTRLTLSTDWWPPGDEHLAVLARLTGLHELHLEHEGDSAEALTDRGLAALTALTRLTQLKLSELGLGVSDALQGPTSCSGGSSSFRCLHLTPAYGKAGRVSKTVTQQLKERCERSPQLWPETKRQLEAELKAAKAEVKAARKEAAKQQKKAAAAEREMAALRAQLAQQQVSSPPGGASGAAAAKRRGGASDGDGGGCS